MAEYPSSVSGHLIFYIHLLSFASFDYFPKRHEDLVEDLHYRLKMLCKSVLHIIFYMLTTIVLDYCAATDYSVRSTKYGKVKGIVERVHGRHRIEKFFGIPYARAPVGKLRLEVRVISFNNYNKNDDDDETANRYNSFEGPLPPVPEK